MRFLFTAFFLLAATLAASAASASPVCPNSPATKYRGYWDDCVGIFTWADGNKYVGEFKNGKIDGYGYYLDGARNRFNGDMFFGYHENHKRISGLYLANNGSARFSENYQKDLGRPFSTRISLHQISYGR